MLKEIRHSGMVVNDLNKAREFYIDLLGFIEIEKNQLEQYDVLKLLGVVDTNLTYMKLGLPNNRGMIELYYFESPKTREWLEDQMIDDDGYEVTLYNHIAITVDNVEDLHYRLIQEGIHCESSPTISNDCKHKIFFSRDPFGNLLEFVEVI